jgi:hypothetical protein
MVMAEDKSSPTRSNVWLASRFKSGAMRMVKVVFIVTPLFIE